MFLDPEVQVTTLLAWVRECTIIGAIVVFGWKARAIYQGVVDFTDSVEDHMKKMCEFADRVETNHLRHIELYLYKLAKDRNSVALMDPELIAFNDVPPPQTGDHADASNI